MEPGACGVIQRLEIFGHLIHVLLFDLGIGGIVADIFQLIGILFQIVQLAALTLVKG